MLHMVTRGGAADVADDDLHERLRAPRGRTRYIFVVDSSGSHAVQERMRAVKGTVKGLLDTGRRRHDEVVVIACRGASASVVVGPTSVLADADRVLEYLPTGGRTPLAHALELAAGYVTDSAAVIVLTDGHANVPTRTGDPWADTLAAARGIRCSALVVDSEDERRATGRPKMLADAMGGQCVPLAGLEGLSVLDLVRETP
jgi:magnesium chelatase subunit D